MEFKELIENYFFEDGNINIERPKEENEIKKVLNDKFGKIDNDFFNDCEDLINAAGAENQYNGFITGFKNGFECAKSLSNFFR